MWELLGTQNLSQSEPLTRLSSQVVSPQLRGPLGSRVLEGSHSSPVN